MANGLQIAASGLIAQEWRLDAVANDIANVEHRRATSSRAPPSPRCSARAAASAPRRSARAADAGCARRERQPARGRASTAPATSRFAPRTARSRSRATATSTSTARASSPLAHGAKLDPPISVPDDVDANGIRSPATAPSPRPAASSASSRSSTSRRPTRSQARSDGLLRRPPRSGAAEAERPATVQQGVIEQSNVDLATALTDMMDAQRSFQLASSALHTQDQLLEIANGIRR